MIEASVVKAKIECDLLDVASVKAARSWSTCALNDAVISAGSPFRMIELSVGTDDEMLVLNDQLDAWLKTTNA